MENVLPVEPVTDKLSFPMEKTKIEQSPRDRDEWPTLGLDNQQGEEIPQDRLEKLCVEAQKINDEDLPELRQTEG
jgi:hypothetical protein